MALSDSEWIVVYDIPISRAELVVKRILNWAGEMMKILADDSYKGTAASSGRAQN